MVPCHPYQWLVASDQAVAPSQTSYNYHYQHTINSDDWYMVESTHEEEADELCGKMGDGTVPYHSLSWAHTWLGKPGTPVHVTQTPQSVYFSSADIREVSAVRTATAHHAQYAQSLNGKSLCLADDSAIRGWSGSGSSASGGFFNGLFGSSSDDQITFYESKEEVNGAVRSVSTAACRVDGRRGVGG